MKSSREGAGDMLTPQDEQYITSYGSAFHALKTVTLTGWINSAFWEQIFDHAP